MTYQEKKRTNMFHFLYLSASDLGFREEYAAECQRNGESNLVIARVIAVVFLCLCAAALLIGLINS
jgi:hypothetical protein